MARPGDVLTDRNLCRILEFLSAREHPASKEEIQLALGFSARDAQELLHVLALRFFVRSETDRSQGGFSSLYRISYQGNQHLRNSGYAQSGGRRFVRWTRKMLRLGAKAMRVGLSHPLGQLLTAIIASVVAGYIIWKSGWV